MRCPLELSEATELCVKRMWLSTELAVPADCPSGVRPTSVALFTNAASPPGEYASKIAEGGGGVYLTLWWATGQHGGLI